MTRRSSKPCELSLVRILATTLAKGALGILVSLALGACAGVVSPAVARESPKEHEPGKDPPPRHPDGVYFNLSTALPMAREEAPAQGIIALRDPVSREEVLVLVRSYFRAFLAGGGEASSALSSLALREAKRMDEGGGDLLPNLVGRLRNLDYSHVSPETVAAYDEMRMMTLSNLNASRGAVADVEDLRRPEIMREGDILCQVPILVKRMGGVRLFGNEVVFLLRRPERTESLKIAGLAEDGAPWPSDPSRGTLGHSAGNGYRESGTLSCAHTSASVASVRARSSPKPTSLWMTKSAAAILVASGICAATRACASSSVLPSRMTVRVTCVASGAATTTSGRKALASPFSTSSAAS